MGRPARRLTEASLHWDLHQSARKIRVGAVSYLNTVPLVWGMLHGDERAAVDLSFSLPSLCAERVDQRLLDVGLVPVAEIARQGLSIVSDYGIAATGAVRSILLVSQVPLRQIRTLAVDAGSRTSVQLVRIILRERYGITPAIHPESPDLRGMLAGADAALIIGDAALRIDPEAIQYECLDLGSEWYALTGLPMVFAAWAGREADEDSGLRQLTGSSYVFGRANLSEIVESEYERRGISRALATQYFEQYIQFELDRRHERGLEAFLELAGLSKGMLVAGSC